MESNSHLSILCDGVKLLKITFSYLSIIIFFAEYLNFSVKHQKFAEVTF